MFLKRFKEKSVQKYFRSVLKIPRDGIHERKIESVGVILNYDEYNNIDKLRLVLKDIGIKENRVKVISFISNVDEMPNSWDSFFGAKDFGWHGKIENIELQEFINTKFDALICYFTEENLELKLATALSKANFKIGISSKDDRLFDFIINIDVEHVEVFHKELVKYLKRFNKI